jgi:predicted membrane channel-forming protein YqfA (hemolysin III family)
MCWNHTFKKHKYRAMKLFIFLLLTLVAALPAYAYIDPGTGTLAVQGLIALIIGIVAFVRHPIKTAREWLKRWRKRDDA